jgi:hypothetical protein
MLDLPGTAAHLEFTATAHIAPPAPHVEALLVLYLGDQQTVDRVLSRLAMTPVPSANPYWDRVGVTVVDPDGFRVVLYETDGAEPGSLGFPSTFVRTQGVSLITCPASGVVATHSKAAIERESRLLARNKRSRCRATRQSDRLKSRPAVGSR